MYKIVDVNHTASFENFVSLLQTKWNFIYEQTQVFKYKINLEERVVDETYLLQLNPDRQVKRRTPEQITNICQPFNENKFNFTKVEQQEILFDIVEKKDESSKHTVIVNVSPISRYHALLCPLLSQKLPQVVTKESLKLVLDIMVHARDCNDLRIGFNGLCAMASVNHLHYHIFLEPHDLPIESAKCKHIISSLYCIQDYPCPAFAFEYTEKSPKILEDIYKLLSYFLKESIAHNIMITRGKSLVVNDEKKVIRVCIWPRKSVPGAKQLADFNIAVCELSGWFPVFNRNAFENIERHDLEIELQKWKIDNFDLLCERVKSLY